MPSSDPGRYCGRCSAKCCAARGSSRAGPWPTSRGRLGSRCPTCPRWSEAARRRPRRYSRPSVTRCGSTSPICSPPRDATWSKTTAAAPASSGSRPSAPPVPSWTKPTREACPAALEPPRRADRAMPSACWRPDPSGGDHPGRLAAGDHRVGESVVDCLLSAERLVPVGVAPDLGDGMTGVAAEYLVDLGPYPGHLLGLDRQVGQGALSLARRLVQQHLGVRQHRPFPWCARGE